MESEYGRFFLSFGFALPHAEDLPETPTSAVMAHDRSDVVRQSMEAQGVQDSNHSKLVPQLDPDCWRRIIALARIVSWLPLASVNPGMKAAVACSANEEPYGLSFFGT